MHSQDPESSWVFIIPVAGTTEQHVAAAKCHFHQHHVQHVHALQPYMDLQHMVATYR